MASLSGFNASEVEPNAGYEAIPAGHYEACIVDSEMKPTKSGSGQYLKLAFEVLSGDFAKRKLFVNLNLDNPNETAVKIARGELSAICRAVGVLVPNDSSELHNIPLVIKVKCKKRADTGEIQNEIGSYHPAGWKPGDPVNKTPTAFSTPKVETQQPVKRMGWISAGK